MLEEAGRLADFAPGKTVMSSHILGDKGFVAASGSNSLRLAINDVGDVASPSVPSPSR